MQFKKHILVLLAFFLLISNSGLAFNVHYCGEKIAAISSVFSSDEVCKMPSAAEKKCCSKKEATKKKCCSDKEVSLKSNSEKFTLKSISFDFDFIFYPKAFIANEFRFVKKSSVSQTIQYYCDAHAPPLYKLYCQYTFYA